MSSINMRKWLQYITKICVTVLLCLLCVSCGRLSNNSNKAAEQDNIVYICTGGYATKYHNHKYCKGLGSCKGEIIAVEESEAIEQGRTFCRICY